MKAFVNNRTDLVAFKAKFKDNWQDLPLISANLDALDHAKSIGFKKLQLVTFKDDTIYKSRYQDDLEANYLARTLDAEIGHIISQELELESLAIGWSYLNLYYMIYCSLRMRRLGFEFNKILENEELLVHVPSNNPYLYFDSWLQNSVFLNLLEKPEIIQLKSNGLSKSFNPDFEYNFNDFTAKTLVHIPTIFYEQDKVSEKILASEPCMHLPSQFWDINLGGTRASINLNPANPNSCNLAQERIAEKLTSVSKKLIDFFNISQSATDTLKKYLAELSHSQIKLFKQLSGFNSLSKMIISDHDTLTTGPLLTYAQTHEIAVDVYPHSYICTGALPDTSITVRHGILNPISPTTSLTGHINKHVSISNQKKSPIRNKNILILLNEFEDVSGTPIENFSLLFSNLKLFVSNLESNEFNVQVRPKPHHNYRHLVNLGTKIAGGNLQDWVDWPAIVISLGTPTTALLHFTDRSASFHAQTCPISVSEHVFLHPETTLIVLPTWQDIFDMSTKKFKAFSDSL